MAPSLNTIGYNVDVNEYIGFTWSNFWFTSRNNLCFRLNCITTAEVVSVAWPEAGLQADGGLFEIKGGY